MIARGEIRWLEEPDGQPRPALVLVRNDAIANLSSLTVAPLTRTVRNIPTEVLLGPADGVAVECVAAFDHVRSVRRPHLTDVIGVLAPGRWHEVCAAMRAAIDC